MPAVVGPTGRLRIPYASSKPRGSLIGLLTNRPSSSRKVPIEVKLSSPEPISAVIENASAIYVGLARGLRTSSIERHLLAVTH